jgi:predicted amidophosphoribosyltransferase
LKDWTAELGIFRHVEQGEDDMNSPKICPVCSSAGPAEAQICLVCGQTLGDAAEAGGESAPAASAPPEGGPGRQTIIVDASGISGGQVVIGNGNRVTQVTGGLYSERLPIQGGGRCPNPACARPVKPNTNFCPACGVRLDSLK